MIGHHSLKALEAVGENADVARGGEDEDHFRLGRLVVLRGLVVVIGVGIAGEPPGADEQCPVLARGEPVGLLDAGDDHRAAAVRLHAHDASSLLLGDQHAAARVEGEADRALEPSGDDRASVRVIGRDAGHRAGGAVGDENVALRIDHDAPEVVEAVGVDLDGIERTQPLGGARSACERKGEHERHTRREPRASHRCAPPGVAGAPGSLYCALRMRSISSRVRGRAPSTVVTCSGCPSSSTIRSQRKSRG